MTKRELIENLYGIDDTTKLHFCVEREDSDFRSGVLATRECIMDFVKAEHSGKGSVTLKFEERED